MGKKHTTEEWQKIIDGWKQSGQTQKNYCQAHRLKLSIFGYWHRRIIENRQELKLIRIGEPSKVIPHAKSAPIILHVGNLFRLEIPSQIDYRSLESILNILEARR